MAVCGTQGGVQLPGQTTVESKRVPVRLRPPPTLAVKGGSRVKSKKPSEWQKDSIRLLIEEAKIRNNFDDNELALYLGFCTSSFRERKANPEKLTIEKLQILLQLTRKEMKFVETA